MKFWGLAVLLAGLNYSQISSAQSFYLDLLVNNFSKRPVTIVRPNDPPLTIPANTVSYQASFEYYSYAQAYQEGKLVCDWHIYTPTTDRIIDLSIDDSEPYYKCRMFTDSPWPF